MGLGVKGLALLLLLVLLVLCSSVPMCDARSGKHWRSNKAPSTSLLRRKGKAKSGSSSKQNSKGSQNPYQPSPSTSPNVPVSPSGSSGQGKGRQGPTMPTPSTGSGYAYALPSPPPSPPPQSPTAQSQDTVFNVVDFGAKGDGVTDDTQVITTASKLLCLMQALRFYGSSNVTVTGITIVNSSQCHLKFDSCQGVMVHDITISSPENSPNTDGIHLVRAAMDMDGSSESGSTVTISVI